MRSIFGTLALITTPMPTSNQLSPRMNPLRVWVVGILAGILLTIVLAATTVWLATGMGLLHLLSIFRGGAIQMNVDQPTVVRQIRQLQRLETVSYTMDKIIGGGSDNPYLPKFLVGDQLLLLVHGEVVAGVNLAKLQPGDVAVNGRNISISLPAAEVFSTRIDNAKTRVYSRDTGLFTAADPNLESEVRQEGERQLQQSALQDGILKAADQNARTTISSLLQGLGFNQVTMP
jgi:hypothetical protein